MRDYKYFLESIKTDENRHIVTAFQEAYSALMETPHSETTAGDVIDVHVEDVLSKLGRRKTLEYVNGIIHKLQNDLPVDFLFTDRDQVNHLNHPKSEIRKDFLDNLIFRLNTIKKSLV